MPKLSFLFVLSALLSIFITLTVSFTVSADSGPIVAVTGGQIRGTALQKGGAVFKGIPYARPPVGDLRWREPMPVKPWSGVREATEFGAICAQGPRLIRNQAKSSEDCLFLNIWTPESGRSVGDGHVIPLRKRRRAIVALGSGKSGF